jgi:anti-sigma regulatory factor (Ser/Thr protein kinase)
MMMGSGMTPMVLCLECSDAVAADARCPTCGNADPLLHGSSASELRDEGLLDQVGVALAAQAELARRVAAERADTASRLLAEGVVLRGRLRQQRSTLRARVAEEKQLVPKLKETLGLVDQALDLADRRGATGASWKMSARLPRDRTCPTVARRLLDEYARQELDERESEDTRLIASELATNAFVHGMGEIVLSIFRSEDRLRIELRDEGNPERIDVLAENERDRGGHGLWIVDQLATEWGSLGGKGHVWAEVALDSSSATAPE